MPHPPQVHFGDLFVAPPMETELLRAYRRLRAGLPLSSRMTRIAGGALETNATVLAALDQPEDAPCMLLQPPYLLQPLLPVSVLTLSFQPSC